MGPSPPTRDRKVPLRNCSQIGNYRLSTSCGVVERPDHHCGDDLVITGFMIVKESLLETTEYAYILTNCSPSEAHGDVISCLNTKSSETTYSGDSDVGWGA